MEAVVTRRTKKMWTWYPCDQQELRSNMSTNSSKRRGKFPFFGQTQILKHLKPYRFLIPNMHGIVYIYKYLSIYLYIYIHDHVYFVKCVNIPTRVNKPWKIPWFFQWRSLVRQNPSNCLVASEPLAPAAVRQPAVGWPRTGCTVQLLTWHICSG
jgi:hypothetical protein